MRLIIILSGVLLLLTACSQEDNKVDTTTKADATAKVDTTALAAESRQTVKEFFGQLKGELQAAMQSGGPINAIEVCQVKAPMIASDISKKKGWRVARTTLKTRNPANKANAWEQQVLQRFEEQKQQGKDPKQMEHYELVDANGVKTFRYMKAIPTGGICIACHGAELAPDIAQKINQLYPDDQATGYVPGDIRGAFTISQTIR